jgi:hypothetical protein
MKESGALLQEDHAMMWTPDRVRDELPDVTVRFAGGLMRTGRVGGRRLPFARVTCTGMLGGVEVAWKTIADCLNSDTPILI